MDFFYASTKFCNVMSCIIFSSLNFLIKRRLLLGNNLTTQRVSTMKGFLVITSRDNVSGIKKLTE